MATKKSANNKRTKRRKVKTPVPEQAQTIAELRRQLAESLQRENVTATELQDAVEQQTTTSEVLRAIASSSTDVQSILDVVAESAARLCDSTDAFIWRKDDDALKIAARYGRLYLTGDSYTPIDGNSPPGRAVVDGKTIHVEDLAASEDEFPWAKEHAQAWAVRGLVPVQQ